MGNCIANEANNTYSSHSLTLSSWLVGIVLMWTGARLKSLNTKTRSKFFKPNWTRSRCAISISLRVMTKNGGSVKCTKHSVVGCSNTLDLKGTPWKPNSRKGISISNRPSLCKFPRMSLESGYGVFAMPLILLVLLTASAIFSENALNSWFNAALRRRSSCSDSNSSSSPYIFLRLLLPVSSNCTSDASR